MFVKPLALLFTNVLLVLVFCCVVGPSHQNVVKDGKEARSPCLCDRVHLLFPDSRYFPINRTSCVIF
jgi:hypothetical protein